MIAEFIAAMPIPASSRISADAPAVQTMRITSRAVRVRKNAHSTMSMAAIQLDTMSTLAESHAEANERMPPNIELTKAIRLPIPAGPIAMKKPYSCPSIPLEVLMAPSLLEIAPASFEVAAEIPIPTRAKAQPNAKIFAQLNISELLK